MKRRPWTVPQVKEFVAVYPTTPILDLMARFGRTRSAIKNLAKKLNLRKTEAHIREHCRLRQGHPACGWNRGMHYAPKGSEVTQFKTGGTHPRQRPVGAECVRRDGSVYVKVAEPHDWRPKARVIWEKHFGQIPEGMVIRPIDGNRQNCALNNLRMITRGEHIRMNWKPRRPKRRPASWAAPLRAT